MHPVLLAPTVALFLIAIAITKISPQPRPWSQILVISILLTLAIRYILWRSLSTLNLANPMNGFFSLGLLGLFFMEMLVLFSSILQLFLMLKVKNRRREADQLAQSVINGSFTRTNNMSCRLRRSKVQ